MVVKMNRFLFFVFVAFTSTVAFAQSNIFDGITEAGIKLYQSREAEIDEIGRLQPQLLEIPNDPNSISAKRSMYRLESALKYSLKIGDEQSSQLAKILIAKKYNAISLPTQKKQTVIVPATNEGIAKVENETQDEVEEGIITKSFIKNIQKYKELGSFHDGLACVNRNGKYGYINIKGEEVIPCSYTNADDFSNGVARVIDGKVKYIDVNGSVVSSQSTPSKRTENIVSSNGFAIKEINGKFGFANANGKIVIPCKYDGAKPFRNGYAAVEQYEYINGSPVMSVEFDPHWGVIDESGKVIIPFKYNFYYDAENDIPLFSEGMAIVQDKTEQFGFFNKDGRKITPCKYTVAKPFSNGVAYVEYQIKLGKQGNKVKYATLKGYVDVNGKDTFIQPYSEFIKGNPSNYSVVEYTIAVD